MTRREPKRSEVLRERFVAMRTDDRFTEAVVTLSDGSLLCFVHRVGERRARSVAPRGSSGNASDELLESVRVFRLNARHLEIVFDDGSRWEWKPDRA